MITGQLPLFPLMIRWVQLEIINNKLFFSFHGQLQWNFFHLLQEESRILSESWIFSIPLYHDSRRCLECHQKSTLQNVWLCLFDRMISGLNGTRVNEKLPGDTTRCFNVSPTKNIQKIKTSIQIVWYLLCSFVLKTYSMILGYFHGFQRAKKVLSIPTASPYIPTFIT